MTSVTPVLVSCGGRGIRTPGDLHPKAFQEPRIRPLCHPSGASEPTGHGRPPADPRPRRAGGLAAEHPSSPPTAADFFHPPEFGRRWARTSSIQRSAAFHRPLGVAPAGRAVGAGGRVGAQELQLPQAGVQVPQAVGHYLVGHVALEVDDEAVLAELPFGRPGLQLHQVEVPGRELAEDPVQAPGMVARLKAHDAGLVVPGRRRDAPRRAGRPARSGWSCRPGPRSRGPAPPARRAGRPAPCRWRPNGGRPPRPPGAPPRRSIGPPPPPRRAGWRSARPGTARWRAGTTRCDGCRTVSSPGVPAGSGSPAGRPRRR